MNLKNYSNKIVEKLNGAEAIGMMIAGKVQTTILDNKFGRGIRGFIKGISQGWSGK